MDTSLKMEPVARSKKIHPHKFAMWMAIAAILMMFAGLTSAYIVRKSQDNWRFYHLPDTFWASTAAIVLSSVTITLAIKAFKKRSMPVYRRLITVTITLGLAFAALQCLGFYQLYTQLQPMTGVESAKQYDVVRLNGNPSESFLFVITGLHMLHVLGGVIALLIVFFRAYMVHRKVYNATGLEVVATYWHFVDALWIYLFVFFLVNQHS
jgi:cytochrome c oxidase subunit III